MASSLLRTFTVVLFALFAQQSIAQKFGFEQVLKESPETPTVFCVPNHSGNISLLNKEGITIKFSTSNWLFITATPQWISEHKNNGSLDNFYFEFAPPQALSDTARVHHYVNQVHSGQAPLEAAYTGKDVIIGVIDQGIDWAHPDFIDANGNTRVLRYWDHSMSGPNSPSPYGYGQEWDSTDINNLVCTSTEEASAHGSSVAGIAAGNGFANGTNMGMAPDANLVIVETNFGLPNWTLTVADAVDYIFSIADSYNLPAVVNLSLGSYFGSHDGNDPAAEAMEALLDEKNGRIIVAAAGNSGAQGNYHLHHDVSSTDTNFVWFLNNPSGNIGANTIFFDLWSDQSEATFNFAIGADSPAPDYNFAGRTNFHGAMSSIGVTIEDTIWNGSNRIATMEVYTETVGNNYHMQMVINVDSVDHLFRFETVGSGSFDLWSGEWLGYNDMEHTNLPTTAQMPDISNYILPDSNQTIVSSWNCSEKVVSVGNMKNREGFVDNNLNQFWSNHPNPVGSKSPNSSLGPNRHDVTKPDVIAAGDHSLGAGPLWLLTNPVYNQAVDSGDWHVLNGGTSMASPVVAGIAALYLERCGMASYNDFMTDLKASAYSDIHTGTVPNNAYGYGKPNAYDLLQVLTLEPQPTITQGDSWLTSSAANAYQWYINGQPIGDTSQTITYNGDGDYQVAAINDQGCYTLSDPVSVTLSLAEIGVQSISTYPNPTSSTLRINSEFEIESILCFDVTGAQIHIAKMNDNVYDFSALAKGTYTLIITTKKGTTSTSIVRL
jgi:subtilisin family serine protease